MNLIRGRLKKIKRLNIAGSIHNHKLFNHTHKTSNTSHRRKKGSEYKRHKGRKILKKTVSLLTKGEGGEEPNEDSCSGKHR